MREVTTESMRFVERVRHRPMGGIQLYWMPMPVDLVTTLRGSFYTFPGMERGEELLQELVVALLDKGTRRRDKFALAELLESRGAEISFYSDGLRVGFSVKCLRQDVYDVVALLAEQLREPRFDAREFELARAHLAAGLQREMESTAAQASGALSRAVYPKGHPNYAEPTEEALARLMGYTLEEVKAYYEAHFGAVEAFMVGVGDLDEEALQRAVEEHLADWPPHGAAPRFEVHARYRAAGRTEIPMADKANVDVRMGHGLPLRRTDAEYLPLYVGNFILGGNFSARLMSRVRDELGLTYGIGSALAGVAAEYEGHWQIAVTLSPDVLEQGIAATREVVETFVREGATAEELEEKKTTLTGSFKVGLATTGGVASAILVALERKLGVEYLDRYPEDIQRLTLEEVNSAVQRYLHPEDLHMALAGTW